MIGLLILCVCGLTVLLFVGGAILSRRVGWPLFVPGVLALCISIVAGGSVAVLVHFYFESGNDHGIPWIENLGIGLTVAALAFFSHQSLYFSQHAFPRYAERSAEIAHGQHLTKRCSERLAAMEKKN